jgi:hypothetical protein
MAVVSKSLQILNFGVLNLMLSDNTLTSNISAETNAGLFPGDV